MTDVPSALAVVATHLVAAGGALTNPILDVDRGFPTGGRSIRYYWTGEVEGSQVFARNVVGQRFAIAALWPLSTLAPEVVAALDAEMQLLAGQVRTRLDGDTQLGGNAEWLELGYGKADVVTISNALFVALHWDLDIWYVTYTLSD